jgi:hypothetical protein
MADWNSASTPFVKRRLVKNFMKTEADLIYENNELLRELKHSADNAIQGELDDMLALGTKAMDHVQPELLSAFMFSYDLKVNTYVTSELLGVVLTTLKQIKQTLEKIETKTQLTKKKQ